MIPLGIVFCGSFTSSTAIEIDSNPKNAKNITEAPANIPVLPPVICPTPYGAK